jgi:hypothetical protein
LLNGYALLGSLNDKHCGGFRYGPAWASFGQPRVAIARRTGREALP